MKVGSGPLHVSVAHRSDPPRVLVGFGAVRLTFGVQEAIDVASQIADAVAELRNPTPEKGTPQ